MSTKTNSSARNYEPCSTVTGPIDAASILLNLTDYRVITATHEPAGRQVLIEPVATEAACPLLRGADYQDPGQTGAPGQGPSRRR